MTANLTCTQVSALLSFYIDNKLSNQLKQFVEAHLETCPTCRAKFETLKSMIISLKEVHEKLAAMKTSDGEKNTIQPLDEFNENLSAYIDNELDDVENIKIKKYIISNPKCRMELENMYEIKKALHNSFEKTKNESKDDFSKYILKRIDIQEEVYGPDSFAKVVALFIIIFALFTITALAIFWV